MNVYTSTQTSLNLALEEAIKTFNQHKGEGESFAVSVGYGEKELQLHFKPRNSKPLTLKVRGEAPEKAIEIEERLKTAGIFPNKVKLIESTNINDHIFIGSQITSPGVTTTTTSNGTTRIVSTVGNGVSSTITSSKNGKVTIGRSIVTDGTINVSSSSSSSSSRTGRDVEVSGNGGSVTMNITVSGGKTLNLGNLTVAGKINKN